MSSAKEKEFAAYARDCVKLADQADTPELQEAMLNMAREWMQAVMDEEDESESGTATPNNQRSEPDSGAPLGMDSNSRAERDAKIYARRNEGFTCKAIAREFGLSKARVWEIAMHMARKAKWRERHLSWPLQGPDHDDERGNRQRNHGDANDFDNALSRHPDSIAQSK
jgi:hypothetical protein